MAKTDTHRVQPDGDKWKVQRDGNERATSVHDTKREAEKAGREVSKNQGTELAIHRKDGTIERRDSHGNDPESSKG
jgi:YD repeat-containing protein